MIKVRNATRIPFQAVKSNEKVPSRPLFKVYVGEALGQVSSWSVDRAPASPDPLHVSICVWRIDPNDRASCSPAVQVDTASLSSTWVTLPSGFVVVVVVVVSLCDSVVV
jgi:hypothetical protein